ncbi:HAD family hydrolase [Alcanivorax sp. 1008]|uniref:HAD family hydrolase n=1 Tax=Alcanivorax sp. 1008 TaxID=2816853 RepID=UPI001E0308E6|nr:HAD family hydrolase [Alcanivorax sp. 1008]
MSILQLPHSRPSAILFDWHATLVDTHNAMYLAIDDMLARLDELGLMSLLLDPDESKTPEDAKLLNYVRTNKQLHPKVVAQKKISRTDIFEVLFGTDEGAKTEAHRAFDEAYRQHIADVYPLEPDIREQIERLKAVGLPVGVISNRRRDFFERELALVDETGWLELFDVTVCGTDVARRKPAPDPLHYALQQLKLPADQHVWYVGDSTTDVIAARLAGITPIFYNGAGWSQNWLDKIFPGSPRHPHLPDAVVNTIAEVTDLARLMLAQDLRVQRARDKRAD